jgi:hypothetical protein
MAWPASNFPASLDSPTDKVDIDDEVTAADVNGCYDCIKKIEAKIGMDGSAVATSLDYLLKNAASLNPGHKHTILAADTNFADYIAQRPIIKDYGESINAVGSIATTTQGIDITLGNIVSATLATHTTFTFLNPSASGIACSLTLILTNGGSKVITWPASVNWPGGTEPTLSAAGVDIVTFLTLNAGTLWHGMVSSLDSKTP